MIALNGKDIVMNKVKQLPYGVSDFEYVMRDNLYYIDKTMYIQIYSDISWQH